MDHLISLNITGQLPELKQRLLSKCLLERQVRALNAGKQSYCSTPTTTITGRDS